MQLDVVDVKGKKVGTLEVADAVFGAPIREDLFWEVVKAQRAAKRQGTHSTKTEAFVRGGGKKPYKQKGTGNARQGSTRAPHFVGGGVVFGPHPRDYSYTVPKKVRRKALASALSLRAKESKVVVLDQLAFDAPKTKRVLEVLKALGVAKTLLVDKKDNGALTKSVRNLPSAKFIAPEGLNVYDILNFPSLVITRDAVKVVEGRILGDKDKEEGTPTAKTKATKASGRAAAASKAKSGTSSKEGQ
jgi:large subunit ribosomal protein L4